MFIKASKDMKVNEFRTELRARRLYNRQQGYCEKGAIADEHQALLIHLILLVSEIKSYIYRQ